MSASTEPDTASSRTTGEYSLRKQLDALASGKMDNATFLRNTVQRFRVDSDESWEVLSLLDQYHRLGKIKAEAFHELKTKIAEYAMGSMDVAAASGAAPAAPPSAATPPTPPTPATSPTPPTASTAPSPQVAPAAAAPAGAAGAAGARKSIPELAPTPGAAREPSVSHVSLKDSSAKQATSVKLTAPPEPPRDAKVGDILRRRYRLENILGTGSMGTVYEATDPLRLDVPPLGPRMAIKVLHSAVAKRLELLQELRREFQDLQALSHPNILRVYEFDRDGPLAFFTMELLSGISLPRLLSARQQGPLPRPLALALIRDLASAVSYAHSHNFLHGDINPQNIFITTHGEVRLLNFGKAQRTGVSPVTAEVQPLTTSSASPGYASCQVLEGDQRSVQDDVFSLACVACLILSGQHPFRDNSAIEARAMHLRPRRPRDLSHRQWSALRSGLHFDRKSRPADVASWMAKIDLRDAAPRLPSVGAMIEANTPVSHHLVPIAAVGAAIIGLGAAYWVATQNGGRPAQVPASQQPALPQPARSADPTAAIAVAPKPQATTPVTPPAAAPSPAPAPLPPPAATAKPPPAKHAEPSVAVAAPQVSHAAETPTPVASHAKVEMATDTLEAPPGDHAVQVIVRRRGSLRGETRFNWWTESGTAKPGADFVAVVPRIERMEDGQASATLTVAVTDVLRAQPKSFYVVIDEADGGATLSGRRLTMVTLQ